MQSERMHMALVIDEYGGADGLLFDVFKTANCENAIALNGDRFGFREARIDRHNRSARVHADSLGLLLVYRRLSQSVRPAGGHRDLAECRVRDLALAPRDWQNAQLGSLCVCRIIAKQGTKIGLTTGTSMRIVDHFFASNHR